MAPTVSSADGNKTSGEISIPIAEVPYIYKRSFLPRDDGRRRNISPDLPYMYKVHNHQGVGVEPRQFQVRQGIR
ncbi:hypothetical protein M569_12023 [Genlisea aurea]|uniref:Uncharacterized protein n=1 Tax=Genlisea aurea TaxID=192259 RepID=S8CE25_9LAMI|nr:hypothetical protein M569_12023 [Genlisea aurea]